MAAVPLGTDARIRRGRLSHLESGAVVGHGFAVQFLLLGECGGVPVSQPVTCRTDGGGVGMKPSGLARSRRAQSRTVEWWPRKPRAVISRWRSRRVTSPLVSAHVDAMRALSLPM